MFFRKVLMLEDLRKLFYLSRNVSTYVGEDLTCYPVTVNFEGQNESVREIPFGDQDYAVLRFSIDHLKTKARLKLSSRTTFKLNLVA
ncbi:UNVERIFIED_CONTAM: hypothetical protein Sradi_2031000 [Sesamum radiatum]|uniref:Uncharacterized protein n=1 Tax=Sesamum radiatum TaxID=300843 RepID=A0AAW2TH62_SESRA